MRHIPPPSTVALTRIADVSIPTRWATFRCVAYADGEDGAEQLALVLGDPGDDDTIEPSLVRLHSECLTGDVFGSRRCDCGPQLDVAMEMIAAEGRGVIVYLRGHEGRGIGLGAKLRAYELQQQGRDTVDANLDLGYPVDARDYAVAARVLADLGVRRVRLLTNNPDKVGALVDAGFEVERVPLGVPSTEENADYLRTKRERMGHLPADPSPTHDSHGCTHRAVG